MKMVSGIASSIIDKFCSAMSGYYPGEYRQWASVTSDYMVLRETRCQPNTTLALQINLTVLSNLVFNPERVFWTHLLCKSIAKLRTFIIILNETFYISVYLILFSGVNSVTKTLFKTGGQLPTARVVSKTVLGPTSNLSLEHSHFLMVFGSFLDHEFSLSPESGGSDAPTIS